MYIRSMKTGVGVHQVYEDRGVGYIKSMKTGGWVYIKSMKTQGWGTSNL